MWTTPEKKMQRNSVPDAARGMPRTGAGRYKAIPRNEPMMKIDDTEDTLLTVTEVAARLRVEASWVYTHADQLGAYRLGKYLRFSWERVLERLNGGLVRLGSQPNDLHQDQ
jgi:hypothetical protein